MCLIGQVRNFSNTLPPCSTEIAHNSTEWSKKWHHFSYAVTLPNINRFSKLFHCQNQEKIGNNTVTKGPTTRQVCRYTTL